MVKFKVIKGSQLLLYAAITVLLLVVIWAVTRFYAPSSNVAASGSTMVSVYNGAEALSAFAPVVSENTGIRIEVITNTDAVSEYQTTDAPRVLIYHTHTHEAYEPTANSEYVALEAWRTNDENHNVVRVGKELTLLLEQNGFNVTHDTTDHELNDLSTAYLRSEETLKEYDTKFDLYIDLHRDAYYDSMGQTAFSTDDRRYAPLMMLIGRGDNFEIKPDFEGNLSLAEELTQSINTILPGLCKEVMVKKNRYNQHFGNAVLVEVGTNMNTLQEALNSMEPLAEAITEILSEKIEKGYE